MTEYIELKEGDEVEIFEDPLTEQISEGLATLRTCILVSEDYELWSVQFSDNTIVTRKILRKIK